LEDEHHDKTKVATISPRLIRSAFNSLQLICSDFLSSLPNSCFLMLVDTLYNFCSQNDDLNISLTVSHDLVELSRNITDTPRPLHSSGCCRIQFPAELAHSHSTLILSRALVSRLSWKWHLVMTVPLLMLRYGCCYFYA
jgi:hypothetical protein